MVYPSNFEEKVGFDRIREEVGGLCSTRRARELLDGQGFVSEAAEIRRRLELCDELRTALMMEGDFPNGEYPDADQVLRKIEIEGMFLDVEDMVVLRKTLESVNEILGFLASREEGAYPALRLLSSDVQAFPEIVNHIDTIVDRFGKIRDNASAELYALRRTIREREGAASKKLQQILAQAQSAGIAEEGAAVSIRDGRAVIPVFAANKRRLKGFVHDESASGKTVYIEPVEVVEINNELRELEYAERREIVKILTAFTERIRPESENIARAGEYLAVMDMLRAKARYALDNGCVMPVLSTEERLELRTARHPILAQALRREGKSIVPLDMQLDPERRILVISGPNAGGKSVCLKTVGLLQYMFQCGFPVPASENSEMPVFDSIFIDIGDEQSIDDDLSTYSSHLLNMKNMLAGAGAHTLALIDEFGSGTEPVIGGAIAEAILERLVACGSYGVITTHYANIKYYASNTEGVINGAMMFDVQNIRPMFRLETGKPGSSFAIEIARKIGLPEDIIRSASDKAGSDHINLEKQLREIARDKRYWEQKRDRIRITDRKVEELEQTYTDQLAKIKAERAQIIREAKAEAQRLIAEANKQIENTIRTIRESQAEKEATRLVRRDLEEFGRTVEESGEADRERQERIEREMERLRRRQQRRSERREARGEGQTPGEREPERRELAVGCKVRIKEQNTLGEVQSIKGKRVTVVFGQIITTVDRERLEVVSNAEFKRQTRPERPRTVVSVDISQRKLNFRDNIDVRGMRASEALEAVQNFIDDALMVGVEKVTILHGKGTGALKEEIRRYLRSVSAVRSAVDEHEQLGGAGVTIVELE